MICERCNCEHDGNYGSGRFCSAKCARSFATSKDRESINKRVSSKMKGRLICQPESLNKFIASGRIGVKKAAEKRNEILQLPFNELEWNKVKKTDRVDRYKSYNESDIFRIGGSSMIAKRILIQKKGYICELCGISLWKGKPITLQLDHINGNRNDQTYNNLRLLCPNCHSQTETFGIAKNTKQVISDDRLISALVTNKSIRKAILSVGLSDAGVNYLRAKRLSEKYNLSVSE